MADGATIVGSKAALPAYIEGDGAGIKMLTVVSNENSSKTVNIATGAMNFSYYESILQDVVRASVAFDDTGDSIDGKSVMEGLPICGSEMTTVEIVDNNGQSIKMELYVNKPSTVLDDTRKEAVVLNLASKEFFDNEKVRLNTRFDGLISKSVKTILTKAEQEEGKGGKEQEYLNTTKELFIEESANTRNFYGNNWKPFYTINWLARQAVPTKDANDEANKNSAGFMFWETAAGFNFKSIDWLMNPDTNIPKKRFIYNETAEGPCSGSMPEGYDAKVLEFKVDHRVDVQEKLKKGAYSCRTWLFNPRTCEVTIIYPNAENTGEKTVTEKVGNSIASQKDTKHAAKKLPALNPTFNKNLDFSRTEFRVMDDGTIPDGPGSGENNEQISKSDKPITEPRNTLGQSNMRINQLFAFKVIITIPGDFSLQAGDAVYFDAPGHRADKREKGTDEIDKHISGNYIISSLCHYLDGGHTLTKMDLVRDSFGRIPQARKGGLGKGTSSSFTSSSASIMSGFVPSSIGQGIA